MSRPKVSLVLLWVLAPLLLGLSADRPDAPSRGRAAELPAELGAWRVHREHELTPRHQALLGTSDAVHRTYVDDRGRFVHVVAVYHGTNWKSVHPPTICLKGSDMTVQEDGVVEFGHGGRRVEAGRLLLTSNTRRGELAAGTPYLSYSVFGAEGLQTGRYGAFVLHHLPRALVRASNDGFLLRVETWVDDSLERAEARCRDFLAELLPAAEARL